MSQQDTIPFGKLAIGIGAGFGGIIAVIFVVLLITSLGLDHEGHEKSEEHVSERIKPVGDVKLTEADKTAPVEKPSAPEKPPVPKSGKEIYEAVCHSCHAEGLLEAPIYGDKAVWEPRIAKGETTLINNSINGIFQMPPRGGGTFSDEEMKRAVQYMLAAVTDGEPAKAEVTTPAPTPEVTPPSDASPTTSSEPFKPDLAKGEQIYGSACALCHAQGIAGAPKFGDKNTWAPRVAKGLDALFTSALNGLGAMPPKGGQMQLPDADIKSATAYMLAQVSDLVSATQEESAPEEATTPEPAKEESAPEEATTPEPTQEESAPEEATTPEPTREDPESETTEPIASQETPLDLAKGEQVYNSACIICHAQGLAGAPKFGDKAAWAPRLAKGQEALDASALNGLGGMPPKGGQMQLPDQDVKAAVAYMTSQVSD